MYFCEARNLMVDKQTRLQASKKINEEDIESFENK